MPRGKGALAAHACEGVLDVGQAADNKFHHLVLALDYPAFGDHAG